MRIHKSLLMLAFLLPLIASAAEIPDNLEPLPEPPPPPAGMEGEAPEPEVTITKKGEDTIEEYRINGELYMMKVTPRVGAPYYLTKDDANAGWARSEGDVAAPMSIPKWVLFRF
ncbi:DUF2782 domain-containing protein [Methylobacillus arboreus]|uniref:DUF2782 domain-containing protein n=1 Tax=Methylobacillus arboreus TaxID=755170 RepID=UPI001E65DB53|nr:DUF2782 domain-containing protein [Methylobacillus arboreus]MCB5191132.1 DUF2782 domain-containing protein [Methylobacillus arboreus]